MNKESNIFHEEQLTERERIGMRNYLHAYMAEHPATAPLWIRSLDRLAGFFDRYESSRVFGMQAVIPAFALVLVVGVGTSYAAEGAVPGDTLYAVKVMFNEPLAGFFQRSDAAQAEWNSTLVSRRLEEAEQLAISNALTPAAQEKIQSSIALSAADFNTSIAKLVQADDSESLARVQSDFEASLDGHEEVLTSIANARASTSQSIAPILASISNHKRALAYARAEVEERIAAKDAGEIKVLAAVSRKKAKNAVADTKMAIAANGDATPEARVSGALAENSAHNGESEFQQGNFGKAFMSFQAAAREAESTSVELEAEERLSMAFATGTASTTAATSTDSTSSTSPSEAE